MTEGVGAQRSDDDAPKDSAGGRSPAGTLLPPENFRMGGEHFRSDAAFVTSACAEVDRLRTHGLVREGRLLDWGCGAGRLAVGVRERWGRLGLYHGVDVQRPLIEWAQQHLGGEGFHFTHVDVANARYNPDGSPARHIPGDDQDYDVFYAYSVFSHMLGDDVAPYLHEVRRLLRPSGFAFITAFVEDGVEDEVENPPGYGPMEWAGRLHCVRFNRDYFEAMVTSAGLRMDTFEYGRETDGQSLMILRPKT